MTFVCCPPKFQKAGDPDFRGWVLSPEGDRLAGLRSIGITVPGQEGELSVDDAIAVFDTGSEDLCGSFHCPPGRSCCRGSHLGPQTAPPLRSLVASRATTRSAPRTHPPPSSASTCSSCRPTARRRATSSMSLGRRSESPSWSPDGSTLAITWVLCQPGERPDCPDGKTELQTVDVSTGARSVLAASGVDAGLVTRWSTDRIHRQGWHLR